MICRGKGFAVLIFHLFFFYSEDDIFWNPLFNQQTRKLSFKKKNWRQWLNGRCLDLVIRVNVAAILTSLTFSKQHRNPFHPKSSIIHYHPQSSIIIHILQRTKSSHPGSSPSHWITTKSGGGCRWPEMHSEVTWWIQDTGSQHIIVWEFLRK